MNLMLAASFLMGSGNEAFFSLAQITPKIAAAFHLETVTKYTLMNFGRKGSSIAAPVGQFATMVLDIVNTTVARGKIYLAQNRHEPIPLGWTLNAEGNRRPIHRKPLTESSCRWVDIKATQ